MLIKIYLVSTVLTYFFADPNGCNANSKEQRVTVVGTAISNKGPAAVRTDDSLLYILDGVNPWDDKYLGKRMKVTGWLFLKKWDGKTKSDNPLITAIPQQHYGTRKILKKPKWSLVE